jgi:hypothetical protein
MQAMLRRAEELINIKKQKNQAILKPNKSMYYLEKDRAAGMLMGESREGPRALTGFDLVLKPALLHMKEGGAKSCQDLSWLVRQ